MAGAAGSRALPDLVARIRVDSSGVDQAMSSLLGGLGKANIAGIAAAAGIGLVITAIVQSVQAYQKLANEVINYQNVAGGSAEQASRMVEAFGMLGVSEEVAAAGMFKLAKAIDQHQKKLIDLGVVVQTDTQGNIDLNATLLSVSDAYVNATDPAKKATIVFTAFGKAGAEMIPILLQGSAALKQLEQEAGKVFSPEDLARQREYVIHQAEANQNWEEMKANLVGGVMPALDAVAQSVNENVYVNKRLDDARQQGIITGNTSRLGLMELTAQYKKDFDTMQSGRLVIDTTTAAMKAQTDQAAALVKELDGATTATDNLFNSELTLDRANLGLLDSQKSASDALQVWTDLNRTKGHGAPETLAAERAYYLAVDNEKQAVQGLADAIRKQYIAQEEQGGGTRVASDEAKNLVKQLEAERDSLAPGSPLRKYLQEYIDMLTNDIPKSVTTSIGFTTHPVSSSTGEHHLAGGGAALPGQMYTVGEHGPETLVMGQQGGTVIPNGQAPGGKTILPVVFLPLPPSREQLIHVREELRRLDREQR